MLALPPLTPPSLPPLPSPLPPRSSFYPGFYEVIPPIIIDPSFILILELLQNACVRIHYVYKFTHTHTSNTILYIYIFQKWLKVKQDPRDAIGAKQTCNEKTDGRKNDFLEVDWRETENMHVYVIMYIFVHRFNTNM